MEKYDDEGSIGFIAFDAYICPHCLAGVYHATRPARYEQKLYKDWCYTPQFSQAVSHLIKWKNYKLVKREKKNNE